MDVLNENDSNNNNYNNETNIYLDYKELKQKYLALSEKSKKYKDENAKLKDILNQFKNAVFIHETSKNNILKSIETIKNQYANLMVKMNSNKKNSYHIEREYFELKATIDKNALINKISDLENDYNAVISNFERLVVKYKLLSQEYNKLASINAKLIHIEENSKILLYKPNELSIINKTKKVSTNDKKIENILFKSYISDYINNNKSEPVPSFMKFIKQIKNME